MTDGGTRKRGGQPKPAEERKRNNLTFRARDDLRDKLKSQAEAAGRSLSEEIEHRLELSMDRSEQIKYELGDDILRIARAMAMSLTNIEDWKERSWLEDDEAFSLFQATTHELIRNYRDHILRNRRPFPRGEPSKLTPEERAQYFAALGGLPPPRMPVNHPFISIDDDE